MQVAKPRGVAANAIVGVMPPKHLTETLVLRAQWPMAHDAALSINSFDRARQTRLRRLLQHQCFAFPRACPYMGKPRGNRKSWPSLRLHQHAVHGPAQCRVAPAGVESITDAIPSVSIVFNASASAALSVEKESSQTVEVPNSSTTSSSQPPLPSS